jgi:hypothetical protein
MREGSVLCRPSGAYPWDQPDGLNRIKDIADGKQVALVPEAYRSDTAAVTGSSKPTSDAIC